MATVSSIVSDNFTNFFECKTCDYKCSKKQHIEQHYNTTKHKINFGNNVSNSGNETVINLCNCGKKYKDRSGLWKHKKNCKFITTELDIEKSKPKEKTETQDLVTFLMKQNQELQQQILDVCKNGIIQNNTITQVNSNNKTFNLQVFLNEECKDAMNITDFMSSIQLQLEELISVGKLGFVEGISNIIIKNLKALDIHKRPLHCTDLKRETVYIKDNGVWVKDDEDNTRLRKVIKNVAFRNSKNTRLFKDKYPDCVRSESRLSDTYSIIIIEAMGGGSKTDPKESEDKILRRILKELTIDKSKYLS
jgi:hypothetical protein